MFCDLHCHSTASDGTTAPGLLAAEAVRAGVGVLALTDHDTVTGIDAFRQACVGADLEAVAGIEVSANPGDLAMSRSEPVFGTLHILGLFVDELHPALARIAAEMAEARRERHGLILARLRELGVDIEDQVELEDHAVPGRAHLAGAMVARGYCKTIKDAFRRYLGQGAPAYVRRDRLSADGAIHAIHEAGGLAILAHPVQLGVGSGEELELRVRKLADMGLDGLETRHPDHTAGDVAAFERLCERYGLLPSGGSDYHGARKATIKLGSQKVPCQVYERLRERWESRRRESVTG